MGKTTEVETVESTDEITVEEVVKLDEFSLENLINFKENSDVASLFTGVGALMSSGKLLYKGEESVCETLAKDIPAMLAGIAHDMVKESKKTDSPLPDDFTYNFLAVSKEHGKIDVRKLGECAANVITAVNAMREALGVAYEKPTGEKFSGLAGKLSGAK